MTTSSGYFLLRDVILVIHLRSLVLKVANSEHDNEFHAVSLKSDIMAIFLLTRLLYVFELTLVFMYRG